MAYTECNEGGNEREGRVGERADDRAGDDPGFSMPKARAAVVVHHQRHQPLQKARNAGQGEQPEHLQGKAFLSEHERQRRARERPRKGLRHVQYRERDQLGIVLLLACRLACCHGWISHQAPR